MLSQSEHKKKENMKLWEMEEFNEVCKKNWQPSECISGLEK
jgi:hypothetical protein